MKSDFLNNDWKDWQQIADEKLRIEDIFPYRTSAGLGMMYGISTIPTSLELLVSHLAN